MNLELARKLIEESKKLESETLGNDWIATEDNDLDVSIFAKGVSDDPVWVANIGDWALQTGATDKQLQFIAEADKKNAAFVAWTKKGVPALASLLQEALDRIDELETDFIKGWDSAHNPEEVCVCGHVYRRHFDTYEQMSAVGCKYCQCKKFESAEKSHEKEGTAD